VLILSGETLRASEASGCPQGGVLSPLLWNLVVDDLIWGLNSNGYYTVGYADDIAIRINGKFPNAVSESYKQPCAQSKSGVKRQTYQSKQDGNYTFTRKREIKGLKEPSLFSKRIQLSSEVKYLGITLYKGLTWKKQLDNAINKAYKAFWTCRGTFGKTWGLKPKVVNWIYTAVVRPIITYAATIWLPRVKLKTSQAELRKLQRIASRFHRVLTMVYNTQNYWIFELCPSSRF
jgi:hypothetical protein